MSRSLVVHLQIKPEHLREFLTIARAHAENSLEIEDGCLQFQVMEAVEHPGLVILIEVYRDDAAIEEHLGSAHMKAYLERVGHMIAERQRYRCAV